MSLEAKLERVVVHYEEVRALTAAYPDPASPDYARLMKEYAELTPIVEQIQVLRRAQQEMAGLTELLDDKQATTWHGARSGQFQRRAGRIGVGSLPRSRSGGS